VGPRTKPHLMNDLAAGPREENERAISGERRAAGTDFSLSLSLL
jgi:hypothetical protein